MTVLRPPTAADVPALTTICNEGIAGREATFETSARAQSDRPSGGRHGTGYLGGDLALALASPSARG